MAQQTEKIIIGAGGEITRNGTTGELEYSKDGSAPNKVPISQGFLGEVRISILDEPTYQSIAGNGWVLMNGQSSAGSDLDLLLGGSMPNVPNALGRFLRGYDPTASVDPEGAGRSLGDIQTESTAKNGLNIAVGGGHNHGGTTGSGGWEASSEPSRYDWLHTYHAADTGSHTHSIPWQGDHGHGLSGDAETRPTNIAVNYFIKINY